MNSTLLTRAFATAFAMSAFVGAAPAAIVTFDLTGTDVASYDSLSSSVTLRDRGLRMTVNAKRFAGLEVDASNTITNGGVRNSRVGLFEKGAGSLSHLNDAESVVDGNHVNGVFTDFLQLRFRDGRRRGADVTITSLTFDRIAEGGRIANAEFFIVGDTSGNGKLRVGDQVSQILQAATDPVQPGPEDLNFGNVFGIGATVGASWVLSSVSVDYPPALVPLPAGGLLLMTALGGLGIARRKKNRH